jgi:hypothetical protein
MIKIITVPFEELEIYLNKTWYSFLCNFQDKFIFKYTEKSSRQIVALTDTERFFNLDDLWLDDYAVKISSRIWRDNQFVLNELIKFRDYRTEQSEWAKKCRWQKQTSFEVPKRLQTWFGNTKQTTTNYTITTI